nr:phosphopantothenate/pantothenate synthetase [Salinarchaeum laminariae]
MSDEDHASEATPGGDGDGPATDDADEAAAETASQSAVAEAVADVPLEEDDAEDATDGAAATDRTRDEPEHTPEDHPRSDDLETRHRIEAGVEKGITHIQGMHAEGRGTAFDYLLGEETIPSADEAARAAAAQLLLAEHPVLSVNGNVAALVPDEYVELADVVGADLEVNLFNRTEERMETIAEHLREHGAEAVKGLKGDGEIPEVGHYRGIVDADGIEDADVVLVPLEDGDRAEALGEMGKTEIVIDLNPLSRSPQTAAIPIVDNVVRAIPTISEHARNLLDAGASDEELQAVVESFDAQDHLWDAEEQIRTAAWE